MPVTPRKERSVYVTNSTRKERASTAVGSLSLVSHILVAALVISTTAAISILNEQQDVIDDAKETITVGLPELLHTETVLIKELRDYIQTLENQIAIIKRKTLEIKAINDVALNDTEKYVNNPLNAVTMLKRFTADWRILRKYAEDTFTSEAKIVEQIGEDIKSLIFPSEDDFDDAAGNLLRIQDIYKLAPERLAVGEMNGIKLGSEMSWSDCLEIGRKSHQNGDYMLAKFWMETALGKLPPVNNDTAAAVTPSQFDNEKGKFEIMESLIEMEFNTGNTAEALDFVNELLALKPTHKRLKDVRSQIENAIKKEKQTKKTKRIDQPKTPKLKSKDKFSVSTEELLITEICRDSATATSMITSSNSDNSKPKRCSIERGNSPQLLLQPLKIEYISIDPYIVIYHDILNAKEVENLKGFIEENDSDDDLNDIRFTRIGVKKMQRLNKRLQTYIGHSADLYAPWQVSKRDFETLFDTETLAPETRNPKLAANVLFNLQLAKLGGAIVFPQLELSVTIPQLSVLYWSHLNEFNDVDYRTKQHVCPIIAGSQITVYTFIKYAT